MSDATKALADMIAEVRQARKSQRDKRDEALRLSQQFVESRVRNALTKVSGVLREAGIESRFHRSNIQGFAVSGLDSLGDREGFESAIHAIVPGLGEFTYSMGARVNSDGTATVFQSYPEVNGGELTGRTVVQDGDQLTRSGDNDFNYSEDDIIKYFTAILRSFMESMGEDRDLGPSLYGEDDEELVERFSRLGL